MPASTTARYDGYYNTSPECWSVYTEVLAKEYSNAVLFGRVHSLTVDAYAAQHAGGDHKAKSVFVHVAGLYLVLEKAVKPMAISSHLQALAAAIQQFPQLEPPPSGGRLTIFDVAIASTPLEHEERVRAWASEVWASWTDYASEVRRLALMHLEI